MPRSPLTEQVALLLSWGQDRQALELAASDLTKEIRDAELCKLAGICAARLGDTIRAERLWRQALALEPDDAQVHYNLGLLQANLDRQDEAEQCYRRAIALDPANAEAHNNLGLLLSRRGREEAAESCYRRAIALAPGNARAYVNLGALLSSGTRQDQAEGYYRQAIALDPADGPTHSNLGALLASQRRDEEALQCYYEAIALAPGDASAFSNLGILLTRLERYGEAIQCYRRAIGLDPKNAKAYTNLGLLLEAEKQEDEALRCQRTALALDPQSAEIHVNLANLLAQHRQWDEAQQCYRRAIELKPDAAVLHSNFGVMLANRKQDAAAEQRFRQALALDPDYQLAHLNLGFLLLRQGRFAEGWVHHEARCDPRLPDNGIPFPEVSFPHWQGQEVAGKSLLVCLEQGFGDAVQFCRYVPLLKERGVARITLMCRRPLKTLMETLSGVDTVLAAEERQGAIAAHDYWTFSLSLPLHCQTRLDSIPARIPYLRAPSERLAQWSQRLPHDEFTVGLVWQGNAAHHNDLHRSLPALSILAPLWTIPGVRFISLQKGGEADGGVGDFPERLPLLRPGPEIDDFSDTAAIVEHLDLVISVDSAVAHLAGALAKACWVLLPAYRTDWRWLQERDDSPWYPEVMRLFRQQDGQDWATVIADVRNALAELVQGHRPSTGKAGRRDMGSIAPD